LKSSAKKGINSPENESRNPTGRGGIGCRLNFLPFLRLLGYDTQMREINGACIVFDTGRLNEVPESPLIIGRVEYADRDTRLRWVDGILGAFCELFAQGQWSDDDLKFAA
jgi:hypothetical protein